MTEQRLAYRVSEVARLAGVGRSTVDGWIRNGFLERLDVPGRARLLKARGERSVERLFGLDAPPERPKIHIDEDWWRIVRELLR